MKCPTCDANMPKVIRCEKCGRLCSCPDCAQQSRVIEAQAEVIVALETYTMVRAMGDDGEVDEAANNIDYARARFKEVERGIN